MKAAPRFRAIADRLRREIEGGRFAKAQTLPGERELSEAFSVSRATLRRALATLVEEGALSQRHGSGTFIRRTSPKVDQPFSRLVGFSELMRLRGFAPSSRDLDVGVFLPTPEEMLLLAIGPQEQVVRLSRLRLADDVPMAIEHTAAVARFLRDANLPAALRTGADPRISALPWATTALDVSTGPSDGSDINGLSWAFAAVAESGTLALVSGGDNPTTLNFLPDNHVVVVSARDVAGDYEAVLARVRDTYGRGRMPRTLNLVTGPSRSADIEQTLILGAHGPRRLHVVVVDG